MKTTEIKLTEDRRFIYFASDFHLGIPDYQSSLKREKIIVKWLDEIKDNARAIFLMGDIFDFWFEYKTVVPKGFVRLLGKIAELTDGGVPIHLFRGNHDVWAFDYFNTELNVVMHREPEMLCVNNKKLFVGHGDGLGPGDNGYKILKKIMEFPLDQWLFRWLHPDVGTRLGLFFSRKSRYSNNIKEAKLGPNPPMENEMLYIYTQDLLKKGIQADYFIFGHRHIPVNIPVGDNSRYINLGDWVTHFSYAVFDGNEIHLKKILEE